VFAFVTATEAPDVRRQRLKVSDLGFGSNSHSHRYRYRNRYRFRSIVKQKYQHHGTTKKSCPATAENLKRCYQENQKDNGWGFKILVGGRNKAFSFRSLIYCKLRLLLFAPLRFSPPFSLFRMLHFHGISLCVSLYFTFFLVLPQLSGIAWFYFLFPPFWPLAGLLASNNFIFSRRFSLLVLRLLQEKRQKKTRSLKNPKRRKLTRGKHFVWHDVRSAGFRFHFIYRIATMRTRHLEEKKNRAKKPKTLPIWTIVQNCR